MKRDIRSRICRGKNHQGCSGYVIRECPRRMFYCTCKCHLEKQDGAFKGMTEEMIEKRNDEAEVLGRAHAWQGCRANYRK